MILGTGDLIKPAANLASLGPAFTYFACRYVLGIIAFGFIGFETKGRSLEEIDGRFSAHAKTARAKGTVG